MNKSKKIIFVVIAVFMLMSVLIIATDATTVIASGKAGDNINWSLDSSGVLKFYGSGNMYDFYDENDSWVKQRDSVKKIIISDKITSIGDAAFVGFSLLENISLSNCITSIGTFAFYNCSALENISLPSKITSIEKATFYGCSSIKTVVIPEDVVTIGEAAFLGCSSLENVVISDSVNSIGPSAFSNCLSLENIELAEVMFIEGSAFSYCKTLKTITIPRTVITIGGGAFTGCTALETVVIEGVIGIDDYAFMGCEVLKSIYIPEGAVDIGISAFESCTALESVYIPKSMENIADFAFFDCSNLKDVYFPGTSTEWILTIYFGIGNSPLFDAEIHYNSTELLCAHKSKFNSTAVEPTCSNVGYTAGEYCNDCKTYISGHKEIAINTSAHKWDSGKVTTTATCKVSGAKIYTCQHNSAHKKTENLGVNASNHVNIKNVAEIKATCTTKGSTGGVYCNDCQEYISGHKEIPALGHSYKDTVTAPTCTSEGYTTHTCTRCKNTYTDTKVKATGHKWGEWKEVLAPTFTANGKEERSCSLCKKTETRSTDKLSFNVGDLDGNGNITAADARIALRASVGLENLSDAQKLSADVDNNGNITAADARLILRASVGLETLGKGKKVN